MLLFYAITNLHLLNIINVKLAYFQNEEADLYIADTNRISPSLISCVKKTNLFRTVELIPSIAQRKMQILDEIVPPLKLVFQVIDIIMAYHTVAKKISPIVKNIQYSRIFINDFADFSGLMLNYITSHNNTNIRISIVEEGSGLLYKNRDKLYFLSLRSTLCFTLFRVLSHNMLRKEAYLTRIDDIYLYVPDLYLTNTQLLPKKIPTINAQNMIVNKLLESEAQSIDIKEYVHRKYYYFASVEVVSNTYDLVNLQINALLAVIPKNQLLIKDHPRFTCSVKNQSAYAQYQPEVYVDERNYLLESLYSQLELEDKVFITHGSATVLHPKYMFGQEPYVIFTYKLNVCHEYSFDEKVATDLISMYTDKTKILIPETIEEMQEMIAILDNKSHIR